MEWASNVGNPKVNVQRIQNRRTCLGETKHPLLIATKGKHELKVLLVHNHYIMKQDEDDEYSSVGGSRQPLTDLAIALLGSSHHASTVHWPLFQDQTRTSSGKRDPWHFNAPTWEVMCRWTSAKCVEYYMVNYDSDDSLDLWPEDHEDYAEWKMACQYRTRDVEEKYFAESSLLEIPTFMAGALMARRLKSPADLCCLAIAVIKAKAGQCTDKEIAAQHCRAYAYIPQWLYFVALLDKDVDGLIALQDIDDCFVWESPLGIALLCWSQTLHNECLCPRNHTP